MAIDPVYQDHDLGTMTIFSTIVFWGLQLNGPVKWFAQQNGKWPEEIQNREPYLLLLAWDSRNPGVGPLTSPNGIIAIILKEDALTVFAADPGYEQRSPGSWSMCSRYKQSNSPRRRINGRGGHASFPDTVCPKKRSSSYTG